MVMVGMWNARAKNTLHNLLTSEYSYLFKELKDTSTKNDRICGYISKNPTQYKIFKACLAKTKQTELLNVVNAKEEEAHLDLKGGVYCCSWIGKMAMNGITVWDQLIEISMCHSTLYVPLLTVFYLCVWDFIDSIHHCFRLRYLRYSGLAHTCS